MKMGVNIYIDIHTYIIGVETGGGVWGGGTGGCAPPLILPVPIPNVRPPVYVAGTGWLRA